MKTLLSRSEEISVRANIWNEYLLTEKQNYARVEEVMFNIMYFDEATKSHTYLEKNAIPMRYSCAVKGKPGKNGFPLYIALHGGGQTLSNEQQYEHMKTLYADSIENGIYVACRGIRETYNTHFNPESYPLYDRLIQNMILFKNADPNRVYIMGYSAGGDGVYGIAPLMADRFAAVSMSAGHHNGISPVNLMNTPIILQCGDDDTAYDRHRETARFGEKLKALQTEWPEKYSHKVFMHLKKQHAINDRDQTRSTKPVWQNSGEWLETGSGKIVLENTNAVDFLNEHVRNPIPKTLAWDLSTRAPLRLTDSFYWLQAGAAITTGCVYAALNTEENTVRVDMKNVNGKIKALLNWDMVNFDKPITFVVNGHSRQEKITPRDDVIEATTNERGDINFQFSAVVEVNA